MIPLTNHLGHLVYVSIDQICAITPSVHGEGSAIGLSNGIQLEVNEVPKDIVNIINTQGKTT